MAPLIALIASFAVFRSLGFAGVDWLDGWGAALRPAVAVMFLLTASAHWGKRRADLVAMVPESYPNAGFAVSLTGWLEMAGAIGLLLPNPIAAAASCGLALLLILMFPANVNAARKKLTLSGRPVTPLLPRTLEQILFLAVTLGAGWLSV